uniref:Cytochrome P450 n=1 Tax=Trichogramma kaykai TaxID=54128 RepID=A0ABD2W998_9HYME
MESWLWTCLLVASFTYIILKAYKQLTYFSKLDIPNSWEVPFIGSTTYLFVPKRHINEWIKFIYNSHADAKYIGAHGFSTPSVFIKDLDLVKTVLIKNFDHFADRKQFVDEDVDPLFGQNLNFLNGDRWKEVRLMDNCAEKFVAQLCTKYTDGTESDFKDMVGRYTNDVIASCAFGIELDSMKDADNEFYKQA